MRSARSAFSATTSRVTCGVTNGLPSRSPPTHDPSTSGRASSGTVNPAARASRSNSPTSWGTVLRASCSRYQPTALASSETIGLPGRISSVCHRRSTSAATSSSSAPRSSASPTRRSTRSTDCRDDSVGCAVNTGRSSRRSSAVCTSARASPGNSSARRCMRSRSGRCSVGRRVRSSRERCSCSAVLASWKYWENARLSATEVPVSSPVSRFVISAPPLSGAWRDSRRTSSTSSSSSGPPWWARVRPSMVVSRRMSARSDSCSDSETTPADAATGSVSDGPGGAGRSSAGSLTVELPRNSGVVGPLAAVGEAVLLNRASAGTADASAGLRCHAPESAGFAAWWPCCSRIGAGPPCCKPRTPARAAEGALRNEGTTRV